MDQTVKMKLYALELYNSNNEMVRDFVPCMSPDGVVGLYDKIEGKFYENAGKGNFLYEEYEFPTLSKTVVIGEKYGNFPEFSREGYKLAGWYSGINNEIEITNDTIVSDIIPGQTLYAKWVQDRTYDKIESNVLENE
jgi:hypothetical protein